MKDLLLLDAKSIEKQVLTRVISKVKSKILASDDSFERVVKKTD
ncbi:MAG: hypothetical protein WCK01_06060 [Candidatus Uhrbacteria bacterium]|jgi:hypothetical protein